MEVQNDIVDLYATEKEYDFTTSYVFHFPSLDQESIDKIATNLNINKSVVKLKSKLELLLDMTVKVMMMIL